MAWGPGRKRQGAKDAKNHAKSEKVCRAAGCGDRQVEARGRREVPGRPAHAPTPVKAYARLVAPPELVYELEEGGSGSMRYLGDPSQVQLSEVVQNVREVLTGEWQKTASIREALGDGGPSLNQVRNALNALASKGEVERDPPLSEGDGERRTLRWRKPESVLHT